MQELSTNVFKPNTPIYDPSIGKIHSSPQLALHVIPHYISEEKRIIKSEQYEKLLIDNADVILDKFVKQLVELIHAHPELQKKLKVCLKKDQQFNELLSKLSHHVTQEQADEQFEEWTKTDPLLEGLVWCTPDSDDFKKPLQDLGNILNLLAENEKHPPPLQKGYQEGLDLLAIKERAKKEAQFFYRLKKGLNLSTVTFTAKTLYWLVKFAIRNNISSLLLGKGSFTLIRLLLNVLRLS